MRPLHARGVDTAFAAVVWLLALWGGAGLYLWRRNSVASGLRSVALATGVGCALAPLVHVAVGGVDIAGSTGWR